MEHAAKSAGRCADCPAVHAPASVLLRLPAERAAHSGPRWMSRYLPQTVLGWGDAGPCTGSQRLATERASRSRPVATSRHSMQGAPSAQPAGSGRRHGLRRVRNPAQRRSPACTFRDVGRDEDGGCAELCCAQRALADSPTRFATWAGTGRMLRGAVAPRRRIPWRLRGRADGWGCAGCEIPSSVLGLHVSRRGPGRDGCCAEP